MKTQEIIDIVYILNCDMMDFINDEDYHCFEYRTDGFADVVMFMGYPIWDSENEERVYESLNIYLIRKAKAKIERLINFFRPDETNQL